MEYQKPSWNTGGRFKTKRSATSERLAVESLVAVANTSVPRKIFIKPSTKGLKQPETANKKLANAREGLLRYLTEKAKHRAYIAEIAEEFKLPTDQLAEMLYSAKTDGLVELTKTSKGTEAVLIGRR